MKLNYYIRFTNSLVHDLIILLLFCLTCNAEIHSYLNNQPSIDDSELFDSFDSHQVPTLESLFQRKTYWSINNISSPCKFSGYRRNFLCQQMIIFDKEGYEKTLMDTRKLFLSRLELDEEPDVKMNTKQLKFLNQLEADIDLDDHEHNLNMNSIVKTKYDMQTSSNSISNSMHESLGVNNCEDIIEKSNSLLCLNFEVPLKNLISTTHDNQRHYFKIDSVILWFYVKDKIDAVKNIKMEIINTEHSSKAIMFSEGELRSGWNTLDVKDIFHLPRLDQQIQNKTLKITFLIKCLFECKIKGTSDSQPILPNKNNKNEITVSNSQIKKPILSINIKQELQTNDQKSSGGNREKRGVRSHQSKRITHYSQTDYSKSVCKNNYPNSMRECCLITYFVDFNAMKWSWILSPSGFLANYCSGKCNQKKSFQVASKYSQNAEVKLTYNEKFLTGNYGETGELMETCCHPTRMDSLVIKYIAANSSIISKVLPNMIVTSCGCS